MNISISFGGLDSEKKPTVRCRKVFLKCSSTSWLHERTRRNESCVVQKCFRNILISLLASYMDIAATTGGVTSPDQPITLAIISSSLYWVHSGFAPLQVHSFHLCEFAPSPKKSVPRPLPVGPQIVRLFPYHRTNSSPAKIICFDQPTILQRTKTNFDQRANS